LRAETVYLLIRASSSLLFQTAFVYGAVYRLRMAELDPLQLVLVGTVLELSVFLFEIPTGLVADVYSRRLSVILGLFLIGAGFVLEGSLPIFATILVAQVLWGVGFTFTSGAQDAWLADEVGEERLPELYLRGTQVSQAAAFAGVLLSAVLARVRVNLPLLVAGGGFVVLALLLVAVMPERGFEPAPEGERHRWRALVGTFRQGMGTARRRPLLVTLMGAALFAGLASEGIDRLWEAHLLASFTLPPLEGFRPVVWFAVLNGVAMALTLAATEAVRRRAVGLGHRWLVLFFVAQQGLVVAGLAVFALTQEFSVAASAYVGIYVLRHTGEPIFMAWVNRGLEPRSRATVLSTVNQLDALGQVVGGPVLGAVAKRFGLRHAMLAAAGVLSPVLAFYARAWRQDESPVSPRE
jgi:DHA3 family tetracycline resistance protein-like MFS transporter